MKVCAENGALTKVIGLLQASAYQNSWPEKIENGRPRKFLKEFIPELLGVSHFPRPHHLGNQTDRAHHLGKQPHSENAWLCIMIAWIHHFQIKEKILQLAHQQFPLKYRGKAIHFFPDFPAEVMKQRQASDDVQKRVKAIGARIGFIYPAWL